MLSREGDAATAIAGETTVLIPLADLIDPVIESQRLQRAVDKMRGELERSARNLGNASFIEKAPTAVVEKERTRSRDLSDKIARMEEQLKKLGGRVP